MTTVAERAEVVVVGGGIGGSALATVLARGGLEVVVLEHQKSYRDKVRGETLPPWGAGEVLRLDLEDVLLGAGGGYCSRSIPYDETLEPAQAEALAFPLDTIASGVRGSLNVGHPEACEALAQAAQAAGARVERGVSKVAVTPGPDPSVRYEQDGAARDLSCRLVVGADGRTSSIRRQIGAKMLETVPRTLCAGLLVDHLSDSGPESDILGTEGDAFFLVFPRPGARARLYLIWDIRRGQRFTGRDRSRKFLDAYRLDCLPPGEAIAASKAAGPCATYPMNDSWIEEPFAEGVVLVGDAAGWNDPIIGQGLSIALRDARIVSEILLDGSDWSPAAFAPYAEERSERMRRLRTAARIATDIRCTFTPKGRERRREYFIRLFQDPVLAGPFICPLLGPENVPAECFTPENLERILALA